MFSPSFAGFSRTFFISSANICKMTDSSYNSPARSCYGSPARNLKMLDRVYGSPVRSYCGGDHHSSATESEGEDAVELLTEVPCSPDQTIMDGWLKFRDNKKVSR